MSEADQMLDEAFDKFHLKLVELRLAPMDFIREHTDIHYQTYWRCRSSKNKQCSGVPARTKVLAKLEQAVRDYEAKMGEVAA
jgi:hypothetical protein